MTWRSMALAWTVAIVTGPGLPASAQFARPESAALHPPEMAGALSRAASKTAASPAFDARYYHLRIDIDFGLQRIMGTTRVAGIFSAASGELLLDLASELTVTGVREPGRALDFTHADDILAINLGRELSAGEVVDIEIDYEGAPQATGFGAFTFSTVGEQPVAWTLSEPYGARAWWPGKDHPSDKVDSARVTVTVPEGMRVGSNGRLASVSQDGGRATYDWIVGYPIAPYLLSLAAGPYASFSQTYVRPDSLARDLGPLSLPVLHYRYDPQGDAVLPAAWAEVVDALAVFEWWFGPYPFPAEKYGHAEFGWSGGMEHQTMSSMGGASVALVTHELAHQWFGDAVTTRTWPHLWLNEGFASYAEILYWETMSDRYEGLAQSAVRGDQQRARSAQGTLVVRDTADVQNLFDGARVYAKGSAVLHMLRHVMGDEAFRSTLHAYLADPGLAYGTALTADFQRVAEATTGLDLDTFFRQWVTEGTGYPRYEVSYSYRPTVAGGYAIDLNVRQIQTEDESNVDVFSMPVTVAIRTGAGERRVTIENNQREQVFTLPVDEIPLDVEFDPDRVLLSNEPFTLDLGPRPAAERLSFDVSPSPTLGRIRVVGRVASTGAGRVVVTDALGRHTKTLWEGTAIVGSFRLDADLSGVAAGVYFVTFRQAGASLTRPVVVLR